MSTHNICFHEEIINFFIWIQLISGDSGASALIISGNFF